LSLTLFDRASLTLYRGHTASSPHAEYRSALDEGLREDHPIERIAMMFLEVGDAERVRSRDIEDVRLRDLEPGRNEVARMKRQRQLLEVVLDHQLPDARG
jgi:TPP-dependent pyruvate/acetoin dehydrogenase alpha subunit